MGKDRRILGQRAVLILTGFREGCRAGSVFLGLSQLLVESHALQESHLLRLEGLQPGGQPLYLRPAVLGFEAADRGPLLQEGPELLLHRPEQDYPADDAGHDDPEHHG